MQPYEPRSATQLIRSSEDFRNVFGVSRETLRRLEAYVALLTEWQRAINLVAPSTLAEVWHRHVADSAQLLKCVPARASMNWLDLGSGAGFPGLVAAIMMAETPGCRVQLVESDAKKCAFMREVVRKAAISGLVTVDIVGDRIQSAIVSSKVGIVDVVSARALAPLDSLLNLSSGVFALGTVGLFPKGKDAVVEVTAAQQSWNFGFDLVPSKTDPSASIVVVRDLNRR
jgi:16S rRNA (guanine527-N7)-methyltransferase